MQKKKNKAGMNVIRIQIQCFRFSAGKIGKWKINWTCLVAMLLLFRPTPSSTPPIHDNNEAPLVHSTIILPRARTKESPISDPR